jgi:hypothetical protein
MKELLGPVILQNRATRAFETAELYRELDQKNFDDFERLWRPMLEGRRAEFPTWAAAAAGDAQDSHWEWVDKAIDAAGSLGEETFVIECAGETQGLMLVDTSRFARLDSHKGRELVYVDLIATAPWNRPKLVLAPRYKGVGRILIATAISLSLELEFKGRLALHSLPQSESWYRDVAGFSDLGYDAPKRMHYFEVTEAQATAFLAGS